MKKILYILALITFVLCIDKISAYTEYKTGDEVTYNGIDFYVIKNSSSKDDSVTMLKKEPLTVDEVNLYGGVGTENNHVNINVSSDTSSSYYQTAYDSNGYGGMAYYSSKNCYNYSNGNNTSHDSGCTKNYNSSDIKYVVDAWTQDKFLINDYKISRLPNETEMSNLGYKWYNNGSSTTWRKTENTPKWVYSNKYRYWTMSPRTDSGYSMYIIDQDGDFFYGERVYVWSITVRPVVELYKTALGDIDESIDDSNSEIDDEKENEEEINDNKDKKEIKTTEKNNIVDNKTNEIKTTVKVDNTFMSSSIIIIIAGLIIASVSVLIIYKVSNKKR